MNKEILQKVKLIDLHLRRKVNHLFAGQYRSAFKGQGMVFSDFREYIPGDDVRAISWSLTAKMSRPFIKTFEEERESHIILVADISRSFDFGTGSLGKKEVLILLVSLLAFCAQKNQDLVGLLLFSNGMEHYIPPKKGGHQALRIVRELYAHKRKFTSTNLSSSLHFLQNVLKKRSHIFLFSDFLFSTPYETALRNLQKKHDIVSVVISDPFERNLPPLGLVDIEDLETGKTITVDSSSILFQRSYKKKVQSSIQRRNQKLLRSGAELIFVDTDKDIYQPFIQFFKKRSYKSS